MQFRSFACKLGKEWVRISLQDKMTSDNDNGFIVVTRASDKVKVHMQHRPICSCNASLLSSEEFTEPIYMYMFSATQKEKHLASPPPFQSSPSW